MTCKMIFDICIVLMISFSYLFVNVERQLEEHKSFVLRVNIKKWFYKIDVFKQTI